MMMARHWWCSPCNNRYPPWRLSLVIKFQREEEWKGSGSNAKTNKEQTGWRGRRRYEGMSGRRRYEGSFRLTLCLRISNFQWLPTLARQQCFPVWVWGKQKIGGRMKVRSILSLRNDMIVSLYRTLHHGRTSTMTSATGSMMLCCFNVHKSNGSMWCVRASFEVNQEVEESSRLLFRYIVGSFFNQ